ncbi:MAG: hypothetical protein KF906_01305 [Actinobacteria bacterium]|nr:hypothetical protein [Actinomycetota bacterium]
MATEEDQHAADEREFLLGSLEDLEREHDAGDLTDEDYETLRDDYTSRAAKALRASNEKAEGHRGDEVARRRNRGRTIAVAVGVLAFAVLAGLLVAGSLGARGQGDAATGGISVQKTPTQRAQECQEVMSMADPQSSIECFADVLADDPKNAVALTWFAWMNEIKFSDAEPSQQVLQVRLSNEALLDAAVAANPDYSYARALRAVVAFRHGDAQRAKEYLDDFEANDPSAEARAVIEQQQLAQRIDAELAASSSSSTTSTTTASSPLTPGTTTTAPAG